MIKSIKHLFFACLILSFSACGYNKLVDYEENIGKSWSEVANAYDNRANVVAAFTKGLKTNAASGNKTEVQEIEKLLAEVEKIEISEKSLSPAVIEEFIKKQDELSKVLRTAMDASDIDISLVEKLELAHNKIRMSRRKFNSTVSEYNTYKRQFPQNVTAGSMGFDNYEPLKMDEGARKL